MLPPVLPTSPIEPASDQCSEPRDTARALRGLFDVTKGVLKGITITGDSNWGFIAAVAHWLFDLKILVEGYDRDVFVQNLR